MRERIFRKEQSSDDYAKTAMRIFIEASIESPASVYHQAARIALKCKGEPKFKSPIILGEALLADKGRILRLVAAATSMHEKRLNPDRLVEIEVNENKMRQIIADDFEMADNLMVASLDELNEILSETPQDDFWWRLEAEGTIDAIRKNHPVKNFMRKISNRMHRRPKSIRSSSEYR